jgi:hypothetical protein
MTEEEKRLTIERVSEVFENEFHAIQGLIAGV